jgi:hypothetical protein
MPTVIDSLVLELGIKAEDWVRQQRQLTDNLNKTKDTVKKQGEQVEKSAKDAGEMVAKLSHQFLSIRDCNRRARFKRFYRMGNALRCCIGAPSGEFRYI